ncbi:MAG: FAD:protein FMN transferase, partial [Marinifilum sp.]|nr:FAD:protein FMN transferase [Marinifilum sp.]
MYKYKFIILLVLISVFGACKQETKYHFNEGKVFGTFYHFVYQYPKNEDLQAEIMQKLKGFDFSLSTYNPESVISKVNENDSSVVLDDYFITCFKTSEQIAKITNGAF